MDNNNKMIVGALAGGALAACLYGLYGTKAGQRFRNEVCDNCEDFTEAVEKFVCELKDGITDGFNDQTGDAIKKFESVKKEIKPYVDFDNKKARQGLLTGAVVGALAGVSCTLMMQTKSSGPDAINTVIQQASKWKKIISDAMETFEQQGKKKANSVGDMIDLAATGLSAFQKMMKR